MIRTPILILLFVCAVLQASSQGIAGVYISRFAKDGYFIERLELTDDSCFRYQMSGDLLWEYGEGTFTLKGDTVCLHYFKPAAKPADKRHRLIDLDAMVRADAARLPDQLITGKDCLWIGRRGVLENTAYDRTHDALIPYYLKRIMGIAWHQLPYH